MLTPSGLCGWGASSIAIMAWSDSFLAELVSPPPVNSPGIDSVSSNHRDNFGAGLVKSEGPTKRQHPLPKGAQSYLLHQDGSFEVYLSGECEFEFKVARSYLLRYKKKVTGTVGAGSLTNLQGVNMQVLWFWFGVNVVVRNGDDLKFYVGPLSATFDLSSFEKCPRCRIPVLCRRHGF
ncbi:hypothetical protein Cni_G19358 [Canna indica]|uniref:Uncharacterized protein n=1 Tax=Canna indica TaxID=4628 RepID=A0AAQ3KL09_9LILI|nr:hypothetical protein Cni_G19358 [Canna indica]